MDVDLLRPGTVPISPDTILWFEFLLDPNLLENHLKKTKPDPSATDLIVSFLSIATEKKDDEVISVPAETSDAAKTEESTVKRSRKNIALRILALKIAAHLKWDLTILEKLPLPMQMSLLQSLLLLTLDNDLDVSKHSELDFRSKSNQVTFAVSLYHRWVLRAIMHSKLCVRQIRIQNVSVPGLQDPSNVSVTVIEDILHRLEAQAPKSVELLNSLVNMPPPLVPAYETFLTLTEDSVEVKQDWECGIRISAEEYMCQLYYDLGSYQVFNEEFNLARESIKKASELFEKLKSEEVEFTYCSINRDALQGYCQALELTSTKRDLLSQLQHSIHSQYTGIVSILQQDNLVLEIPQMYRDVLEFDIQGATSSGKFTVARDLLFQVQALNVVCRALKGVPTYTNFWQRVNQGKAKTADILFNTITAVMPTASPSQKQRMKELLCTGLSEYPPLLDWIERTPTVVALYTPEELIEIKATHTKNDGNCSKFVDHSDMPHFNLNAPWKLPKLGDNGDPRLDSGSLEQQLMRSYDHQEIHTMLIKLGSLNPGKVLWKINNKWELPIPLQGVVTSLPRGLVQDTCYILLAKARELTAMKDFAAAQQFLSAVEKEAKHGNQFSNNQSYKLQKLVNWEILLVQITHFHADWPNSGINNEQLITSCKHCLQCLKAGESVIPRSEVLEQCAMCLLNLGQWEYLANIEKRWNYFELSTALASACFDVARFKGNKKVCKDAWDLILPVFGPSAQQKRSASGTIIHRDSPTHAPTARAGLFHVLSSLRDPTALAVAISLLARLHNVLRDEPTLELNVEYVGLWPAVVSNANSYYTRSVGEMLGQLLSVGLRFHPNNTSWLKLLADLNFVLGHYSVALKCYLEVAVLVSDFFSHPLPRAVMDDHVYKRMIKCCTNLQCQTQAAVLCQFLEDIDYTTAFKCLGDSKSSSSCSDAMDAYYNCIWDTTILEFLVNLHSKRGENHRKQQALKVIGLLELNANNNEEIQREAANVRKARFMRSMARQYLG